MHKYLDSEAYEPCNIYTDLHKICQNNISWGHPALQQETNVSLNPYFNSLFLSSARACARTHITVSFMQLLQYIYANSKCLPVCLLSVLLYVCQDSQVQLFSSRVSLIKLLQLLQYTCPIQCPSVPLSLSLSLSLSHLSLSLSCARASARTHKIVEYVCLSGQSSSVFFF